MGHEEKQAKSESVDHDGGSKRGTNLPDLESQLQAYAAQTPLLRTRLSIALDTMDELQRTHAEELAAAHEDQERLAIRLDAYADHTKALEVERDDMRDVVLELIQKGRGRMSHFRLPDAVDPIEPTKINPGGSSDQLAKTIIASLRRDLRNERAAHVTTKEQATAELLALRAQLARREAELEACVLHAGHLAPVEPSNTPGSSQRRKIAVASLSQEEMRQIIGSSNARNESLEREIEGVNERLQRARLEAGNSNVALQGPPARNLLHAAQEAEPVLQESSSKNDDDAHAQPTTASQSNPSTLRSEFESQLQRLAAVIDKLSAERVLTRKMLNEYPPDDLRTGRGCGHPSSRTPTLTEPPLIDVDVNEETPTLLPIAPPAKDDYPLPAIPSSDIHSDGGYEESMELATPLQPTVLLGEQDITPTGPIINVIPDPTTIPLPDSPEPPPTSDTPFDPLPLPVEKLLSEETRSPSSPPDAATKRLKRVETELEEAKREIDSRNVELSDLRALVDHLRGVIGGREMDVKYIEIDEDADADDTWT